METNNFLHRKYNVSDGKKKSSCGDKCTNGC